MVRPDLLERERLIVGLEGMPEFGEKGARGSWYVLSSGSSRLLSRVAGSATMSSGRASQRVSTTVRVGLFWVALALVRPVLGIVQSVFRAGWRDLAFASVLTLVALALIALFLRTERRSFSDIGLTVATGSVRRFLGGTVLGIAITAAMLAIVLTLTSVRMESVASPDYRDAIGFSFVVLLVLAYMEEVAFRSFPLVRLQEAWGVRTAIYITAICFAFYHGPVPVAQVGIALQVILLVVGVVLIERYVRGQGRVTAA